MFDSPQQFVFNPNCSHNHIYTTDTNHIFLGCNDMQAVDVGYSSVNEIIGQPIDSFYSTEEAKVYIANNEDILRTGVAKIFEEFKDLDNGGIVVYSSYKYPLKDEKNKTVGVMGMTIPVEQIPMNAVEQLKGRPSDELNCLSPQQLKCFYLVLKGECPKKIAQKLHLSHRTIEHYLTHIRLKLNCKNLRELVVRYANRYVPEEFD